MPIPDIEDVTDPVTLRLEAHHSPRPTMAVEVRNEDPEGSTTEIRLVLDDPDAWSIRQGFALMAALVEVELPEIPGILQGLGLREAP